MRSACTIMPVTPITSKRDRLAKSIASTFSSMRTTSCSAGTSAATDTSEPLAIEYLMPRPRLRKGIA